MLVAPKGFVEDENKLLVGNFGSGTIMAFEADGGFNGLLTGSNHHPIVIDGLWGLTFGNGAKAGVTNALYFTAGLNGEADGLDWQHRAGAGKSRTHGPRPRLKVS